MIKYILILILITLMSCKKEQQFITVIKRDYCGTDTIQTILEDKATDVVKLMEKRKPVPDLYSMFNSYEIHLSEGKKNTKWRYHYKGYIQKMDDTTSPVYRLKEVTALNRILFSPYIKKADSTFSEIMNLTKEANLSEEEKEMIDTLHRHYNAMSHEDQIELAMIVSTIPNLIDSTDSVAVKEYNEFINQSPLYKYSAYWFFFSMASIGPDSTTYQFFDSIDTKQLFRLIEDSKNYSQKRVDENVRLLTLRASQLPQHYRSKGAIAIRAHKNFVTFLFHGYRDSRTQIIVTFDELHQCKKVTLMYNTDIQQEIYPVLKALEYKNKFRVVLDNIKGNQQLPKEGKTCPEI